MKRVLITHAGGELGVGTARALRAGDSPLHLTGVDSGSHQAHMAEVDDRYLVPRGRTPEFISVIKELIAETESDFFWPLHDDEILAVSASGDMGAKTFIPPHYVVALCQDKLASYNRFVSKGVPVPETFPINDKNDLLAAMQQLGGKAWLRATRGAGGQGAFRADSVDEAEEWLDSNDGWGSFTAAELLTGDFFKWESVWHEGELVASQQRMAVTQGRLRTMARGEAGSGNGGSTRRSIQVSGGPEIAHETAVAAVKSASDKPHGIFSVDASGDVNNVPKVTEINVGRFTSIGMIYWYQQGFNFPELVMKLAYDEDPGFKFPVVNPIPGGVYIIQGRNRAPVFLTDDEVKPLEEDLAKRLQ